MKTKILFIALLICITSSVFAREGSVNTGEDFTRPLDRFDIRYKYLQITGDTDKSLMTFRLDAPFLLDDGWKLSTRFDMPVMRTNKVSSDNPNGDYETGFGDLMTQFLLISPLQGNWAYGFGTRLYWPSSSQDQMGTGKYQMAPTFGVNYYPDGWSKGSYCGVGFREYFDYAGDHNRADIHQTSILAGFSYNLPDHWFVSSISDIRINWEQDNNWFVPLNLKLGKILDKTKVVSIEFNTPIVNDYDRYDWQIELQLGFFF